MKKLLLILFCLPMIGFGQKENPVSTENKYCNYLYNNTLQKNIFTILVNSNNQLLVEGELMDISQLKDGAKKFINNNGIDPNSSENPEKAIISLQNDRGTEYMTYIRVQNELAAAYTDLRNNASLNEFGERYADLNKTQMKEIRKMYPQKISEAEPKNIGGDE